MSKRDHGARTTEPITKGGFLAERRRASALRDSDGLHWRRTTRAKFVAANYAALRAERRLKLNKGNFRRYRKIEKRWNQRCRGHCNGPAQRTVVMIIVGRRARLRMRLNAMARIRDHRPRVNFAAGMMMEGDNAKLHAESKQREPNEPNAESRSGHDLRPSFEQSGFHCSCVIIVANPACRKVSPRKRHRQMVRAA